MNQVRFKNKPRIRLFFLYKRWKEHPRKSLKYFFLTFIAIPGLVTTTLLFFFTAIFLENLFLLKHIHNYWLSEINRASFEFYCISNNECGDFTVVFKLDTAILSEAMVMLGRSVHPATLFPGLIDNTKVAKYLVKLAKKNNSLCKRIGCES